MSVPESVDLLMRHVKDEVANRRAQMNASRPPDDATLVDWTFEVGAAALEAEVLSIQSDPVQLNLPPCDYISTKAPFRVKADDAYHLNDFLPYDDVEFVNAAYRALLKREVDEDGMLTYVGMLRSGAPKVEILSRIRSSPEGMLRRARVDGMALSYALSIVSRWPIIGRLVGIASAVWNLPNAERNQRRVSNDFAFRLSQTNQYIGEVKTTVCKALEALEQSQNRLSELTKSFAIQSGLKALQYSMASFAAALESKPNRTDLEKLAFDLRAAASDMEQAADMFRGTLQTKADKSSIDRLELDVMAEIERAHGHWREKLDQIAAQKVDKSTLRKAHEEISANLEAMSEELQRIVAANAITDDVIASVRQTKADNDDLTLLRNTIEDGTRGAIDRILDSLDALKRDSMAVIGQATAQWNDSAAQIAAVELDQNTLRAAQQESKVDLQAANDELRRITAALAKSDEAITSVRQMKADNDALAVLRDAIEKQTRGAVEGMTTRIDALKRDSTAAIERAHAKWNERVEQIAASKVDPSALRAVQDESRANLQATNDELKRVAAALAKTDDAIAGVRQAKADNNDVALFKDSLNASKQDSMAAIERIHVQWNETVEKIAALKVDQTTLRAVQEESNAGLHATSEEIKRIVAALAKTDDSIAGVRQAKADNEALAQLRDAGEATRSAVSGMNTALSSKADQSSLSTVQKTLDGVLDEMKQAAETRRAFADETNNAIEYLNCHKTDEIRIVAMAKETQTALDLMNVRVKEALSGVSTRIQELKHNVLDQERRVGLLLQEARKRLPDPISPSQIDAMLVEEEHQLDAMYACFEDKFRGSQLDIRQRQTVYLPYVRDAKAGTAEWPVFDLGCGRGEWLETLSSQGLSAQGVDLNRIFVAGCRELNLDVIEEDALSFLQRQKANSVGVVTSFHLIEHLAHKKLISLIDETLRVLRPGGLAIFETPNPKNLIVAGCNFYLDPTHRNPLPPDLSRYLLEARGFCDVDILELHPFASEYQITEGPQEVKDTLNKYLFSSQDYAVIARKAG